MTKRVGNNASGKWLGMSDEQTARAHAAFERAVERQRERDALNARTCKLCGHEAESVDAVREHYVRRHRARF